MPGCRPYQSLATRAVNHVTRSGLLSCQASQSGAEDGGGDEYGVARVAGESADEQLGWENGQPGPTTKYWAGEDGRLSVPQIANNRNRMEANNLAEIGRPELAEVFRISLKSSKRTSGRTGQLPSTSWHFVPPICLPAPPLGTQRRSSHRGQPSTLRRPCSARPGPPTRSTQ